MVSWLINSTKLSNKQKLNKMKKSNKQAKTKPCAIRDVVCGYSAFPQTLKAGKKYKLMAEYKERVAIIDETKELVVYNKCYFYFS
jgi:hypothetical protein